MARHAFTLSRAFSLSLALIFSLVTLVYSAPSPNKEIQTIARDASDPLFSGFDILEETYKTVDSENLRAAILMPKGLKAGKHPVILNFHAGWLVTADALYGPFFPQWVLEMAIENSAIIISADHRLLPTVNGLPDPLQDAEDFWQWTRKTLPNVLKKRAPGQQINFSQLILNGASSGGYLATHLGMLHPTEVSILTLAYPWLDLKDNLYTTGPRDGQPNIIGYPTEGIPSREDTIAWIEQAKQTTVSQAGPERVPFIVGASYHGIFYDQILDPKHLNSPVFFPLDRLQNRAKLPANVWLMHGDHDITVPIEGSNRFAACVSRLLPKTKLRYDIAVGQDHMFDADPNAWSSFRQQALSFVRAAWLR